MHQIRNSVKYVGSKNPKEFLSDLKLVYGASTSETGSILCDKFNVFYGFVWKNEIKFVPLPRQERMRWFTPPAVPGTAAWHSSVDIPVGKGTPTGVKEVSLKEVIKAQQYNLAGQKVGDNAKGLVIKNGKKYIK